MANSKDNISKYAISFIGFDEDGGNVHDNISGHVGTVYGNPSRVTGWNNEGKSMSFNGSNQYIQMNNKIIPVGTKSVRFKIKTTQQTIAVIISQTAGTAYNGLQINTQDGYLYFILGKSISGNGIFTIQSNSKINDGNWHDVMCTWTGDTDVDGVKIFIDDMIIPDVKGTATEVETLSPTYNLRIGANNTTTITNYFNGQLDQIEIYDRVISPIPDKHLILHNNEYKYHDGTQWQVCTNSDEDFIQYGHNNLSHITEEQWLELDGEKSIIVWTDFKDKEYASITLNRETFTAKDIIGDTYDIIIHDTDASIQQLELTASPSDQELISLQDIPLLGVETINKVTVNAIGSGKVGFSIDGGLTYRALKSGQWVSITDMSDGNTFTEVNGLTTAQMSLLRGNSNIIRMSFFITHNTVIEDVKLICNFEGSERLASSDLYDVSYNMPTKTVTYKIKKAATYIFTYTDVE